MVWAGVLLGALAPGVARAQRPPRAIAVIEATAAPSTDAEATEVAAALEAQLQREADLILVVSDRRAALRGAIPDDSRAPLTEARAALADVRDVLARFDHGAAVAAADAAIARAVDVAPGEELLAVIADLALARGLALLGDGAAPDARASFALVHRLSPGRTLDPARYLPEVVAAFDAARATGDPATLDVAADDGAEVWVDGARIGPAPAVIQLAPGLHCVTVTGERLVARGQLVDVPHAGATVTLDAAEAAPAVVLHRLRARLVAATGDVERAVVVAEILRLVGGQDAIVVARDDAGALVARIYSGRAGTLGDARPAKDATPVDLIKPLRPLKVPVRGGGDDRPPVTPPIDTPPAWYERRWVQVSIGGTVVAGVVASVVYAMTRPQGASELDGQLVFGRDP